MCSGAVSAATITFTNSFTSVNFAQQSGLALNTAAGTVTSTHGSGTTATYGTEQFSNSANTSFTLTARFQVTSLGTSSGIAYAAITAFGLDGAQTGTSSTNSYLLADFSFATDSGNSANRGRLRLLNANGTNPVLAASNVVSVANPTSFVVDANGANAGVIDLNTTYTLRLDVENTASNTYSLTLGLYDAAGTTQFGSSVSASYTAPAAPAEGYFAGIRSRVQNSAGSTVIAYQDFSVAAIPEPSSFAALGGLGALAFAACGRRRRA